MLLAHNLCNANAAAVCLVRAEIESFAALIERVGRSYQELQWEREAHHRHIRDAYSLHCLLWLIIVLSDHRKKCLRTFPSTGK